MIAKDYISKGRARAASREPKARMACKKQRPEALRPRPESPNDPNKSLPAAAQGREARKA